MNMGLVKTRRLTAMQKQQRAKAVLWSCLGSFAQIVMQKLNMK